MSKFLCPECEDRTGKVVDSRLVEYTYVNRSLSNVIRRRRICVHGHRVTTYEVSEQQLRQITETFEAQTRARDALQMVARVAVAVMPELRETL